MSAGVIGLVLAAAVIHRRMERDAQGGGDRFRSVSLMAATTGLLGAAMAAALPAQSRVLGLPEASRRRCVESYNLLLVLLYRRGDLGVQPTRSAGARRRCSSPSTRRPSTAGEQLGGSTLLGIGLISAGILSLAWEQGRDVSNRGESARQQAAGAVIAGYTIVDGLGARRSGDPRSYAAGSSSCSSALRWCRSSPSRRGWPATFRPDADMARGDVGSGAVVDARLRDRDLGASRCAHHQARSRPSAETTVNVFAALFGWMFLNEPLEPAAAHVMPGRRGRGDVARISALRRAAGWHWWLAWSSLKASARPALVGKPPVPQPIRTSSGGRALCKEWACCRRRAPSPLRGDRASHPSAGSRPCRRPRRIPRPPSPPASSLGSGLTHSIAFPSTSPPTGRSRRSAPWSGERPVDDRPLVPGHPDAGRPELGCRPSAASSTPALIEVPR